MRDLEIRGAGDLLGAEQSGHVAAIGFELYVEILGEAVAELSGSRRPVTRPVRVDAHVDAFIPAAYVSAEARKIDLHRRIALAEPRGRAARASSRDRGSIRTGSGARREPFRDPGGEVGLARAGADYLVFRGGSATVGPVALGSSELRSLRSLVDTAVYTAAQREVAVRTEHLQGRSGWPMLVASRLAA